MNNINLPSQDPDGYTTLHTYTTMFYKRNFLIKIHGCSTLKDNYNIPYLSSASNFTTTMMKLGTLGTDDVDFPLVFIYIKIIDSEDLNYISKTWMDKWLDRQII